MSDIEPGWYPDPVDPQVQRYWDGEGYVGEPLPIGATPPPGPPPNVPAAGGPAGSTDPVRDLGRADRAAHPTSTAPPVGQPPATLGRPSPAGRAPQPGQPAQPGQAPQLGEAPEPGQAPPTFPAGSGSPPWGAPGGAGVPATWPAYPKLVLPPPRPHGHQLATLSSRFVARMIDTLAVLGLNVLVNGWFVYQYIQVNQPYWEDFKDRFYAGESTAGMQPPERSSTLLVTILVLAAALWFAYEVPALANTGQTPGKRLARIKVMRLESDEPLGFRRSMRRWNTLGLPTLLWTCFGLGFLLQALNCGWAVFDRPLHQALHDKSAVTVVVSVDPLTGHRAASEEGRQ